jgi:hypothetical protein
MTAKNAITTALLLFVCATIVTIIVRAGSEQTAPTEAPMATADTAVTVYYFHSDYRCETCDRMEAFTTTAIEGGFADQIESGRLRWRVVNFEEPANRHLAERYELAAASVVLEHKQEGVVTDSKNLIRIWEISDDESAFVDYIRDETQAFLASSGATPED